MEATRASLDTSALRDAYERAAAHAQRADAGAARAEPGVAAPGCHRAGAQTAESGSPPESVGKMARFGVRSGSLAFAHLNESPANRRFDRTGAHWSERSLALPMQKVVGFESHHLLGVFLVGFCEMDPLLLIAEPLLGREFW